MYKYAQRGTRRNKSQPSADPLRAVADDFREGRRIGSYPWRRARLSLLGWSRPPRRMLTRRRWRRRDRQRNQRYAAWEPGGRELSRLPPLLHRALRRKRNDGGRRVLQAIQRDRRQRKSPLSLSRLPFIDTRGFVFQSRHERRVGDPPDPR